MATNGLEDGVRRLSLKKKKTRKSRGSFMPFINEDEMPTCTSKWSIITLESVGVYYDRKCLPVSVMLDMVYDNTGMFRPLSPEQKLSVKSIQEHLMFSFSIRDVLFGAYLHYMHDMEQTMRCLKGKMETPSLIQDFATRTVMLIHHVRNRKSAGATQLRVSKAVYVDLFSTFVKICGLIPSQGEEYRSTIVIKDTMITSTADVVILAGDVLSRPTAISVVSIVEVINMNGKASEKKYDTRHGKTKPVRTSSHSDSSKCSEISELSDGTSSSEPFEPALHEEPEIYRYVVDKVLAQHGAELLVHGENNIYMDKFDVKGKYHFYPGMIVVATKVIFTLLECRYSVLDPWDFEKGKSCIHYSEPKDFLLKEDRDVLIESLVRLSNGMQNT